MTKQEYMQKLQENLERFGQELQEDILEDYRQHFAEGEKQGKSEEEIIEELGNIEEMIGELTEEGASNASNASNASEQERDGKSAFEKLKDVVPEVTVEIGKNLEKGFKDFGKSFEDFGKNFEGFESLGKNFKNFGRSFEGAEKNFGYDSEQSFTHAGDCQAMVLALEVADVTLEPSEDDMIHVRYQSNGRAGRRYELLQYEEEDGTYHVEVRRKNAAKDEEEDRVKVRLFGQTVVSYGRVSNACEGIALEVKVPEGFPRVSASVSSGDVAIRNLHIGDLRVQSASGDVTITETRAGQVDVNSTSGDIDLSGGMIKEGRLIAASGDVDVRRMEIETATISTASGDIELNDTRVVSARFGTGSGDISVKEGYIESLICNTGSGDIATDAGVETYTCGTGSGDITVHAKKAPKKVSLNTGSGDIALALGQASGMTVTVESQIGDTDIRWKNHGRSEIQRGKIKGGSFTYGDGSCKVYVKSGIGDISISAE